MTPAGLRVAVVSLQRLGDVLTAARVTDAFAQRRDVATVDLIHWDQTNHAASMLPGINARHQLPYGALKERGRVHPLAAYRSLNAIVDLLERRYDVVVNLSSTRFSCLIAPLLCRETAGVRGPWIDDASQYRGHHPAALHLNDWGVDPEVNVFAHKDLYALAAGVRLGNSNELPPDPTAQTLCDHMLPSGAAAPIALHIHGSEPSKMWRDLAGDDGWRGLIYGLRAAFGRDVLLLGGPKDVAELDALATRTGAQVAAWSLRHTAELLRRCAGLISVDTVAIHLAAAVGCRAIVLRQGSARGHAFMPGRQTLLVDHRNAAATPDDVVALARRHFFDQQGAGAALADASQRVRVRECLRDGYGLLGAASPSWWPAPADDRLDDTLNRLWRNAWRQSFSGQSPCPQTLDGLLRHAKADQHRFGRALLDTGPLGQSLREFTSPGVRAA